MATETDDAPQPMYLVPLNGPPIDPIRLIEKPDGATLGRHEQCDMKLPADAEKVSRFHCKFVKVAGRWCISDLNSRWGTFLNGVKIESSSEIPLEESDLVRIVPWTFSFSANPNKRGLQTQDDVHTTQVRAVAADARTIRDDLLTLLLESTSAVHAAVNEVELADRLMDAAVRGTGLTNAIMLRPLDSSGRVEVIATKLSQAAMQGGESVSFSRSLLNLAATGEVAELSSTAMSDNISQSIVQMRISAALCVPLMLGGSPAAYLYLDSRHSLPQALRPNASAFAVALGRIASLALANLKRVDMEPRTASIEADLRAGSIAQKWVMPQRSGDFDPFKYIGESKPGRYVGGDFFDLINLGKGKLAVALGDVAGKGVAASVLMTATQGFLHAMLLQSTDPAKAMTATNQFVCPRRPESKFVTAWVGVFDLDARTLTYVDAGHSYALMRDDAGTFTRLDGGDNVPIGVLEDHTFESCTVPLPGKGEVVVVSDGIIEQPGMVQAADGSITSEQFDIPGFQNVLTQTAMGEDCVAALFNAVIAHAGTTQLADDATAVLVRWG